MSQVDTTAQTITDVESAAIEIENRMNASETPGVEDESIEKEEIEETNEEVEEEVESSDDSDEESSEETDSEEPETEEPEEAEESTYENTDDLAEALDMPAEDFLAKIKTKVKVNGEELEVNLSELKAGYQMESSYRQNTAAFAEERRAFESETQAQKQEIESQLTNLQTLTTNIEQMYVQEFADVNWKELEETDPTDYLIKRQKASEAYNRVEQVKQQALVQSQQLAQENQQKQQQEHQETLNREYGLMLEQNPDWSDEAAFKQGQADIQSYLSTKGFSEGEINQLVDHRIVSILRDAIKAKETVSKVELAKKKVKKLPKVVKSGAKQTRKEANAKSSNEKVNRFKKSGSQDDLAAALLDRM